MSVSRRPALIAQDSDTLPFEEVGKVFLEEVRALAGRGRGHDDGRADAVGGQRQRGGQLGAVDSDDQLLADGAFGSGRRDGCGIFRSRTGRRAIERLRTGATAGRSGRRVLVAAEPSRRCASRVERS